MSFNVLQTIASDWTYPIWDFAEHWIYLRKILFVSCLYVCVYNGGWRSLIERVSEQSLPNPVSRNVKCVFVVLFRLFLRHRHRGEILKHANLWLDCTTRFTPTTFSSPLALHQFPAFEIGNAISEFGLGLEVTHGISFIPLARGCVLFRWQRGLMHARITATNALHWSPRMLLLQHQLLMWLGGLPDVERVCIELRAPIHQEMEKLRTVGLDLLLSSNTYTM